MKEKTFSYREVNSLLCEACAKGVMDIFNCDTSSFYHVLNGERVTCTANEWRTSEKVHELLNTIKQD